MIRTMLGAFQIIEELLKFWFSSILVSSYAITNKEPQSRSFEIGRCGFVLCDCVKVYVITELERSVNRERMAVVAFVVKEGRIWTGACFALCGSEGVHAIT